MPEDVFFTFVSQSSGSKMMIYSTGTIQIYNYSWLKVRFSSFSGENSWQAIALFSWRSRSYS